MEVVPVRWPSAVKGPTRLRGIPLGVKVAFVAIVVLPVVAWLAQPPRATHLSTMAGIINTMLGTLLATIVFMLWAAQNSRQVMLNHILEEFSERDRRLCAAARSDHIEPWLPQMQRELQHLETIAAIAVLGPAERRLCQWDKRECERAVRQAQALKRKARAHGQNALSQRGSRDFHRLQERATALTHEREAVIRSACHQLDEPPTGSTPDRELSRLAMQFEDVLNTDLRPLETAYVLTASVVSLTAIGAAYSRDEILRPVPPGLLAATIVAAIAVIYIAVVRRAMTRASMAFARRLRRLTAPTMHEAGLLLSDRFVLPATSPGKLAATKLQEALGTLPPAELPLRHRLLGQYHLAAAWQALPGHGGSRPCMADFEGLLQADPRTVEVVVHELELARDHLEQTQDRHDDPFAVLALAAVRDAMAAVRGEHPAPHAGRRVAEAVLSRPGSDGVDWVDELQQHRWLWPRDPGQLTELVAGLDRYEALPVGHGSNASGAAHRAMA
jgi:hypothetical protein